MIILTILYAIVGWLTGLAINHAADILPKRQTLLQRPSCGACGTPRPYAAWSVLLAWLAKRTYCLTCRQPRSSPLRWVIIEFMTPLFFVFLLWQYGISLHLIIVSIYTTILILITVTDLEHRLIFNVVILPSILVALLAAFVTPGLNWPAALVGGGFAFILMYIAALISRGGLGEGDVTLSTFLGLILGFPHILLGLVFGVFLGGFVVVLLLITRRVKLKSFVPYGPFLTITGWIMLIWGQEIWQYYFS